MHEKDDEMKVKEVVPSYGGLCGGTYVDKNFYEFLKRTIGCLEKYVADKPKLRAGLQRIGEEKKRTYTGDPDSFMIIDFEGGLERAWQNHEVEAGMKLREGYDG